MTELTITETNPDPAAAVVAQLATIKPEQYVIEVFKPFRERLKKAAKAASSVTYEITTTAGMAVAKEQRAIFRKIRTEAEAMRKERKAPIIEIGKLLDARYKELEAGIAALEDKYDADIKAEEARKEEEKQRAIEAERVRVEAIQNRIKGIRDVPLQLMQADSAAIASASAAWSDVVLVPEEYDEFLEDALSAVNATIVELGKLHKQAVAREQEAARIERERAELAQLKAEQEKRERAAAAERDAERRAAADREAAIKQERDAMAAQMAELQRQLAAAQAKLNPPEPDAAPESDPRQLTILADAIPSSPLVDAGYVEAAPGQAGALADAADGIALQSARPTDAEIIGAVADHFQVSFEEASDWIVDVQIELLSAA